ncbi:sigma D regulator [Rheinheimera muenzenbergensis]|uniref:Sigma D regulator n=1 Tax=Rheinheimera muenzenbergensis TaxID=1193628 RepID=A0ABU8C5Q1_9GAMM|nr:sigma D regulator [Gammaproteobacteria bacterium]MBU1555101.1 sigma D regulator [Gammaproteobacteria bacterium]MBU2072536.1 sigma D regulator [Gammaproteobacteria bacterium]MBU2184270.1 sigma D regulator [Gammaproteobacteria bacterium]MBU2206674.1 sigma D regulator [Gammaproteobacteria bacterium]
MYTRVQNAQQKWGGSLSAIDTWLEERQQLIVSYCKLAALPPFDHKRTTMPSQHAVQEFCQLLVDYLSAGHFEVYERIVSECAVNGTDSRKLADSLYPKIAVSTDLALNFNDNYAEHLSTRHSGAFDRELSALGQALEERFEYEDELINTLHEKHSDNSISA